MDRLRIAQGITSLAFDLLNVGEETEFDTALEKAERVLVSLMAKESVSRCVALAARDEVDALLPPPPLEDRPS